MNLAAQAVSLDALAAEFGSLGGILDNVVLREGCRGRGLFAIDPAMPVVVKVPPNLLVPSKEVEIREGQLLPKPSAVLGERERAFFERYQLVLGWGAGVFDQLKREQAGWNHVPEEIQNTLRDISLAGTFPTLFTEASEASCLQRYLATRQSHYRGEMVLMPFVELANCNGQSPASYQHEDGIAIRGTFEDEILVNYNGTLDCWDRAVCYGFFDATVNAFSMAFHYQSAEGESIRINRRYDQTINFGRITLPVARLAPGDTVEFSYLMLGNIRQPRLPRGIFQHLCKKMPLRRPDEMFDIVQHYNRTRLLRFLVLSEGLQAPPAAVLRRAACEQLTTLSNCWGTVPLGA